MNNSWGVACAKSIISNLLWLLFSTPLAWMYSAWWKILTHGTNMPEVSFFQCYAALQLLGMTYFIVRYAWKGY